MFLPTLAVFLILSLSTQLSHGLELEDASVLKRADARCSAGTFSSSGNTPCTKCLAGSYSKDPGQKSCILARAGYYIPSAGGTSETPCPAGSYSSSPGRSSCLSCPSGFMCPSSALATPQQCSPGRFSHGGVKDCQLCPAGYFNNIQQATDCCLCAAGWFNAVPGNTNCQMCSAQTPNSDPGTTSSSGCSSKAGSWAPSKTCQQGSDGRCPASLPRPSSKPRRLLKRKPKCLSNEQACPVYRNLEIVSYTCTDVQSNLESCGGCNTYSVNGLPIVDGGQDCSTIPFVSDVHCEKGACRIGLCQPGFILSLDGRSCIYSFLGK